MSVLALLAGCGGSGGEWAGGPVEPSMVPIRVEASPRPITEGLGTGVRLGGSGLVLVVCCEGADLTVYPEWTPRRAVDSYYGGAVVVPSPFFGVDQLVLGDGRVVEYGGIRGEAVTEVVVESPDGVVTPARFTAWPGHPDLLVFWVEHRHAPIPDNVRTDAGRFVPLAPERYPLITARGRGGALIGSMRLRPGELEEK